MKARKFDEENYNRPFPKRLRVLLDNEGGISPLGKPVTQTELAQAFHQNGMPVTRQTISLYANGETKPDIEKFKFIADFFNVSYDFLLGESEATQRDNINIAAKTGLWDESINTLERIKGAFKSNNFDNVFYAKITLLTVNHILFSADRIWRIAKTINKYLHFKREMEDVFESETLGMHIDSILSPRYAEWLMTEEFKDVIHKMADEIDNDPRFEDMLREHEVHEFNERYEQDRETQEWCIERYMQSEKAVENNEE